MYSNNVIKENDFQYVAIKDDEKQNVVKYGDVLFTLSSETPEEVGVGSVYLGAENGGYPPTQNGDIRSLFWLFSLMALQN